MKIISAIENVLSAVEKASIVVLLGVMVVLAFLQVLLRNLFSFGFLWADPLLRYMVLWVGFLGAVLATSQDKHLGIEFLNRMLRPKAALALKIVVEIFAVIVSALLAHAAYQFLMEGIAADELDLLGVSKRVYFLVIPAGFGLITLHFLLRVVRNAARLMSVARTGPSPETEEEA